MRLAEQTATDAIDELDSIHGRSWIVRAEARRLLGDIDGAAKDYNKALSASDEPGTEQRALDGLEAINRPIDEVWNRWLPLASGAFGFLTLTQAFEGPERYAYLVSLRQFLQARYAKQQQSLKRIFISLSPKADRRYVCHAFSSKGPMQSEVERFDFRETPLLITLGFKEQFWPHGP